MPAKADFTGQVIAGWTVGCRGRTTKRITFWNVVCPAYEHLLERPHAQLSSGKIEPCEHCHPPVEVGVSNGHHIGPDETSHLVGTPCATRDLAAELLASVRAVTAWRVPDGADDDCPPCEDGAPHVPDPHEPRIVFQGEAVADHACGDVSCGVDDEGCDPTPEPAWEVHGRAEGCEGAQDALDVLWRHLSWPAREPKRTVGMSNMGGCERKLGHRLLYGVQAGDPAWRVAVGTAVDAATIAPAFEAASKLPDGTPVVGLPWPRHAGRWVTKILLTEPAWGEVDIYDRHEQRAIDTKVAGTPNTKVKEVARGIVENRYQVQLDLYGLGLNMLGYPVREVALLVLPAAGELEDAAWYCRPWNEQRARDALARVDRINALRDAADGDPDWPLENPDYPAVLAQLDIEDDHCDYCPVRAADMCEGVKLRWAPKPALIRWEPGDVPPPPGVA